jgi:hypothetical protein
MSADANAIPLKKSRSDLSRTGRPIAIDMAPPQVRSAAIVDSRTLGYARIEHRQSGNNHPVHNVPSAPYQEYRSPGARQSNRLVTPVALQEPEMTKWTFGAISLEFMESLR